MQHLLLLHGAIGSKNQFEKLKNELQSNYIVHTINFSGHEGEAISDDFSIQLFAQDVLTYLEKNNIDVINIFGYSMGGYVGLYLAKEYPKKINKIFTLGTKFLWTPEIATKEIKMLDADKIEQKIPAFAKELAQRHSPNNWKTVLEKTKEMMTSLGNNNILKDADFSSIEHKVQIGIGDKDTMVTLEETVNVYRQLKNASFIVLPNTQHPIEKVDLKRLSNEIKLFF